MNTLIRRCVLLLVLPTGAYAAPAADGADYAGLIPQGWQVVASARGDLNRDGRPDAAIVIQQQDPATIIRNDSLGSPELDTNPRQLWVLLRQPAGWKVAAVNRDWLPPAGDAEAPCLADPLADGGLNIQQGRLQVALHYWYSCGSWGVNHHIYTFRQEGQRFRLIGLDQTSFMRNSGDKESISTNYLSGRQKLTSGDNEFEPKPGNIRERWRNLSGSRHWYLDGKLPAQDAE